MSIAQKRFLELHKNDRIVSSKTKTRGWKREDFEIASLLGEGSLSKVYLALNTSTQRRVALKIIAKQKVFSKQVLQSIILERNILLKLNPHPNIVFLISCFQDEAHLYFQLEWVVGGSLADVLSRYGLDISPSLTFYWACDIVNILIHLRSNNVAHRDIKPDNLLLDEHRRLKLIDFNNAILVADNDGAHHAQRVLDVGDLNISSSSSSSTTNTDSSMATSCSYDSQAFFGALHYLPPEAMLRTAPMLFKGCTEFQQRFTLWKNNNPGVVELLETWVTPYAVDIWNFGCVLFEIFCGCHPFRGNSDIDTVFNVLNYKMATPPAFMQESILDFIVKMLHRNPVKRSGVLNVRELVQHPFFIGVDLTIIPHLTLRPEYPTISSESDEDRCMSDDGSEEDCFTLTRDFGSCAEFSPSWNTYSDDCCIPYSPNSK